MLKLYFPIFLVVLFFFILGCEECKDEKSRCHKECDRVGTCVINYEYNSNFELVKSERACRWIDKVDLSKCGDCSDIRRNDKGNITYKNCVVCNLCNDDFQCLSNEECKGTAKICALGICVECVSGGDCSKTNSSCLDGACKECSKNEDCKTESLPNCLQGECVTCQCKTKDEKKPYCKKGSDFSVSCVACKKDEHCSSPNPICNEKNVCVAECKIDSDCRSGAFCSDGQCVDCRNREDCKDAQLPVCSEGLCTCTKNSDCSSKYPICSKEHRCVECMSNGDCPIRFPLCKLGACVLKECFERRDCNLSTHKCLRLGRKDVCVECVTDSNCAAGTTCDVSCWCCK